MTAPDTNVDRQVKRHKGPLFGIVLALIVAIVAAFYFTGTDDISEENAATTAANG